MIESIKLVKDDETGEQYRDYEFEDGVSDWEKEAIREYGVSSKSEVEDALNWREAVDALGEDNPQQARIMRGLHPTKDKETGRPNNPGKRPDHAGGN